jgi:hypothetical protein
MGRSAKLVKVKIGKNTYWSTSSGGKRAYFGNVKEVSRVDADTAFIAHRKVLLAGVSDVPPEISVGDLCEVYFDWAEDHVSDQNREMKKADLEIAQKLRWNSVHKEAVIGVRNAISKADRHPIPHGDGADFPLNGLRDPSQALAVALVQMGWDEELAVQSNMQMGIVHSDDEAHQIVECDANHRRCRLDSPSLAECPL